MLALPTTAVLDEEQGERFTKDEICQWEEQQTQDAAWQLAEDIRICLHDSPGPHGYMSAFVTDKPSSGFFYNRDLYHKYLDAPKTSKNSVPGHGYFKKIQNFYANHFEKGQLYHEYL